MKNETKRGLIIQLVGVMLLIKKLGRSIEEQIAGLLHDVSYTAFSHVVDFVFVNIKED